MWISVSRPNILRMWNGKITHRSLVLFKTLEEPNTYQSAHNTVWVISDRERSAARQTNPSSFVSAACKKLKLIISNWKTAFIRKRVYIYIPQPPHCPFPSLYWKIQMKYRYQRYQKMPSSWLLREDLALTTQMHVLASDTWQLHSVMPFSPAVLQLWKEAWSYVEKGKDGTRRETTQSRGQGYKQVTFLLG